MYIYFICVDARTWFSVYTEGKTKEENKLLNIFLKVQFPFSC